MVLKDYINQTKDSPNMHRDLVLFRQELEQIFPDLKYTSGYRPGAKTASGAPSRHGKGEAWDIANRPEVYNFLWNTGEGLALLNKYGLGVLDETDPKTMKRTGATGKHFHIGKDSTLVPLARARYREFTKDGAPTYATQTNNEYESAQISVPDLSVDNEPDMSFSVGPADISMMEVFNQFRFDNMTKEEVEESKQRQKTAAESPEEEQDVVREYAEMEQQMFVDPMMPDPYNYIKLEEYQNAGVYTKPKDERLQSRVVRNTIPTIKKDTILENKFREEPEEFSTPKIFLDEVVVKVSKEQLKRQDKVDKSQDLETSYIDRTFEDGIVLPKTKKETLKVQEFLASKGYDLDPNNRFKNKGVDGLLGKVTKGAINQYNESIKDETIYTSEKKDVEGEGKKGFLGECTEDQCSEYVQNEIYRNVAEKEFGLTDKDRVNWNKKIGITGDAWDLGNNIIKAGGKEVPLTNIQPGDVVGINSGTGGETLKEAEKALGRRGVKGYTHSGIVDEVNPDGSYYILHNWHKLKEGKYVGQEYRTLVQPDGNLPGFSGDGVVEAIRPNYRGEKKDKVAPREDVKLVQREDNYTNPASQKFAEVANDTKLKGKFMNNYDIDETEFYSISKAAIGIMGQETDFGTDPVYSTGFKRAAAETMKGLSGTDLGYALGEVSGKGEKFDEVSRGPGSMKLETNFNGAELSLFGINKGNINKPENAMVAAMMKLTNEYKNLRKRGFSNKDALYRAIQRYNGSLSTKSAGKTREEWAKDYDLDYPNKVINFASDFDVTTEEGTLAKTIIDELAIEDNVVKWVGHVQDQR
jgi:hypothetical protein